MIAEYNTPTVDQKNLHVNHELTNIILYMFINYTQQFFYFIKITFNIMHKCVTFKSSESVAMDSVISLMAVFFFNKIA
jgi:hypothetical protein